MKPGQLHRSPHRRHVWAVVLAEHDGVNRMICLGCGKPKDEDVSRRGRPQRTAPMKRRARRDPVTPELRIAVLERDGGCLAVRLGENPAGCGGPLQLDHVRDQPMMGKRAPSDPEHLASVCSHHHLDGWATSHRPELRTYLEEINAAR